MHETKTNASADHLIRESCPHTGLEIITRPKWLDVSFSQHSDYRYSLSLINGNIILSKASGRIEADDIEKAFELFESFVSQEINPGNTYVIIEDLSSVRGISSKAKEIYASYHLSNQRLKGLVFFGATPFMKIVLKMGIRISSPAFPVTIAPNYTSAINKALELTSIVSNVARRKEPGDKTLRPSLLPMESHWSNIRINDTFSTSFGLIDGQILHTASRGNCGRDGMEGFFDLRGEFMERAGVKNIPYVEIKDLSGITGQGCEGRRVFIRMLMATNQSGHMAAFIGYNAPLAVRISFAICRMLYPLNFRLELAGSYANALERARGILLERGIMQSQEAVSYDESLTLAKGFSVKSRLINGDIIHSVLSGKLRAEHIDGLAGHIRLMTRKPCASSGAYYLLLNISDMARAHWSVNRDLIRKLNSIDEACGCSLIVLYGSGAQFDSLTKVLGIFSNYPVREAIHLDHALEIIHAHKANPAEIAPSSSEPIAYEDISRGVQELLDYMGEMTWDRDNPVVPLPNVAPNSLWKPLYDAINLIKNDFDEAIKLMREAEHSLRITQFSVDTASDPIFWIAPDGQISYANESASNILGYPPDILLSKKIYEISEDFPESAWAGHWKDIKTRKSFKYETNYIKADGAPLAVEVSVNHIEFGDKEYSCAFVHDMSVRKWAEQFIVDQGKMSKLRAEIWKISANHNLDEHELLQSILKTLAVGLSLNNVGFYGYSNPQLKDSPLVLKAYWSTHGSPPPKAVMPEFLGAYLRDKDYVLIKPDRAEKILALANTSALRKQVDEFLSHGGEILPQAFMPYRVNNILEGWFSADISGAKGERGPKADSVRTLLKEAASIAASLTAQRRADAELKKAYTQMEDLVKHKDMFISRLGHDLKTPLTPLVSLLPIIQKQESDPRLRELLDINIQNVNNIKELVIKTLKLARVSSPAMVLKLERLNLRSQVQRYIEKRSYIINKRRLSVDNLIRENLFIMSDENEIEEIFYNLITNAAKYTPEGGHITINAYNIEDKVLVEVRDTGIGLTEEQIKHVFEEFFKADESRHELDSSGLGLSICRKIVEKHGGEIWAESAGQDLGTAIKFTISAASMDAQ